MGMNIHGIRVGYLLCGPERWMMDRGPICTKRLFGAAMKKTDKTVLLCSRTRYVSISLALL